MENVLNDELLCFLNEENKNEMIYNVFWRTFILSCSRALWTWCNA